MTQEIEYKCDICDKTFDIENEMVHTVEYNGCMDLCRECYYRDFSECDNCGEDFYKDEIHLNVDKDNTENWYCDECLNTILHENEGLNQ